MCWGIGETGRLPQCRLCESGQPRKSRLSFWLGPGKTLWARSQRWYLSEVNAPEFIDQVPGTPPAMPQGGLDAQAVSAVIARLQPVDCIVMDEVLAVGVPYFDASKHSPRFTHLILTGGAIGQGPSAATGAAIACPNRKVINFQSDGCGAYSVQAFWTQARENLDVVTIVPIHGGVIPLSDLQKAIGKAS